MGGMSVAENIQNVREKIARAATRAGRKFSDVQLVAVSKTKSHQMIQEAIDFRQFDFGENYVQEFVAKLSEIQNPLLRWHYIGSLQRNKCKQIVGRVHLIHSVDRVELAQEISKVASTLGHNQNILLQIKIGSEESKSGVEIERAEMVLEKMMQLSNLNIMGVMTFPPLYNNLKDARRDFKQLADFQKLMKKKFSLEGFNDLSMGTSHDYEVAIEEGATIVRVGSEIFGERMREQP